jgi:hypothetical protein
MSIKQDVNAPLIVTIGIVSGLLLLVIVFGLQAWFVREETAEINGKWDAAKYTQLIDLRAEQQAKIHRDGADDKTKARTISIDKAMQVIAQTGGKLPSTRPATNPQAQPEKK